MPTQNSQLVTTLELYADVRQPLSELFGPPPDLLRERFDHLASQGVLQVVTLRQVGRIVGCWIGTLSRHPEVSAKVIATTETFFVPPPARGRIAALRLVAAVAKHVRSLGATDLLHLFSLEGV